MKEQAELAQAKYELDRMDNIAYDYYCNLEIAVDALKQINGTIAAIEVELESLKRIKAIAIEALATLDTRQSQAYTSGN
jgi:hypothetical protein